MCRNGLFDEYQEIKSQAPDGTFDNARLAQNQAKVGFQHHLRHLHLHHLPPHYHLETSRAPCSKPAKMGFQSSFQYNKPRTIRHVFVGLPGSERSECVKKCLLERSFAVVAHLDENLRSPPIWSQPMRLKSSAMWLRMLVGETINMAGR